MTTARLVIPTRADLAALAPRPRATVVANATLVARQDLDSALARFTLRPDAGPTSFLAGQYVQVRLLEDGTPPRPYSIASSPGSRDLDLMVSLVDGGALTPKLFRLPLGSRLYVGRPAGRFRLARDDDRHHVLIGTGGPASRPRASHAERFASQ